MRIASGYIIADKYELGQQIGKGGMGTVWLARDRQLDRPVAIKFVHPIHLSSPEARHRFEREAKASGMLTSPHNVRVHEYGVEDDVPYLVMEMLTGETLSQRLKKHQVIGAPEVTSMVEQVCKALQEAHDSGIVHRDIKLANIFFARTGDDEIVKVLDFGIARATWDSGPIEGLGAIAEATKTGSLMGSPHYMSPEQVRSSKKVNCQTDLWSLGVVAFRSLTGRFPFSGDGDGDVMMKICTETAPAASEVAPWLPRQYDAFFAKALERDLTRRFQSAREMARAVSHSMTPRPPPASERSPAAGRVSSVSLLPENAPTLPMKKRTSTRPPPPPAEKEKKPSTRPPASVRDASSSLSSPTFRAISIAPPRAARRVNASAVMLVASAALVAVAVYTARFRSGPSRAERGVSSAVSSIPRVKLPIEATSLLVENAEVDPSKEEPPSPVAPLVPAASASAAAPPVQPSLDAGAPPQAPFAATAKTQPTESAATTSAAASKPAPASSLDDYFGIPK